MRPPLSLPIGSLQPHYDVVVVGSGYGGSVVAYRLAERAKKERRPISIALLERGREWMTGDFPSTAFSAFRQLQYETPEGRRGPQTGLYDLRNDDAMMVLVGCGLGGTSLINANVMIRPKAAAFARGWPTLERSWVQELGGHYDEVVRQIGATPLSTATFVRKRDNLSTLAPTTHLSPDLAVSFTTGPNPFGVDQRRCEMCGDCTTGCNHGAKRTLDFTYLAGARAEGVSIFCEVEVHSVAAQDGDHPWLVHARPVSRGWGSFDAPTIAIRAKQVFLAAGTLGTTEILLRSRRVDDDGRNPNGGGRLALSSMLGSRFSGNGDVIAFSYNGREKVEAFGYGDNLPEQPTVGPCITSMLDERDGGPSGTLPLSIQDAAVPGALASIVRFIGPWIARQTPLAWAGDGDGGIKSEVDTLTRGPQHGAVAKTQVFLVQAPDSEQGTIALSGNGRVRIHWSDAQSDLFRDIHSRLAELTRALGGRFAASPFWIRRPGGKLITVHPLGGARMADSAADGVVNHCGQVFKTADDGSTRDVHGGLYACDGAIVPTALGANPALTIAALADRIAIKAYDDLRGAPNEPPTAPATTATPPGTLPRIPGQRGIRYAERLTGRVRRVGEPESSLTLTLHLSALDVDRLLVERRHAVSIVGTAETPAWTQKRWSVTAGTLNALVEDPRRPDTRLMVYRMWLEAPGGERLFLRGHKTINLETCRQSTWDAITSVPFVVRTERDVQTGRYACLRADPPGDEENQSRSEDRLSPFAVACDLVDDSREQSGVVKNLPRDAVRLVTGLEITNAASMWDAVWRAIRFGWFFTREVIAARVWFLRQTVREDPFHRPIPDVPDAAREVFRDARDSGAAFLLTRYKPKAVTPTGHVILGPGFGMSADAFLSGQRSLAQYLLDAGYVVWLLDYRASDHLAASLSQFTLDDLVEDFRRAFKLVYEKSGNTRVHVIGHCVASLVTSMALLKYPDELSEWLESVVLSQSFAFMDHPLVNRIKAGLYVPELMKQLRFNPVLSVDDDLRSGWKARLFDKLLHLYPTREHCSSGVCRRTIFLYGEVVRHENLDRHTHAMMYDFFDRANLSTFVHLARMIRAGRVVDHRGNDTYLVPEQAGRITLPITFVQGLENRLFRPSGAEQTVKWFRKHAPSSSIGLVKVRGYAHLDHFIGKDAERDVFPTLLAALTNRQLGRDQDGIAIGPSMR